MLLLTTFVLVAVVFSFLCSIAEAVLLSVTTSYVVDLEKKEKPSGPVLKELKDDINSPLAVILTLNTIAHTIGAAGAGAQATVVFGSAYLGLFSAILTLIILVFSEIIPKALGAQHWRRLAPVVGYSLKYLIKFLYPFVVLSNKLTARFTQADAHALQGFSRSEFAAMAELGEQEGQLDEREAHILQNIFLLQDMTVRDVMTPRIVLFSLSENETVEALLQAREGQNFSRIPVFDEPENITGFVLRSDVLMARAQGKPDEPVKAFRRELPAILDKLSLLNAFDTLISEDLHMMLVVNEYGEIQGLVTMEDIFETLLGLEITDESDRVEDMQKLARSRAVLKKIRMRSENRPDSEKSSGRNNG